MSKLHNKIALVTGGNKGIGKAIALGLAGDFVPAFQRGKAQGRPPARKDGLVEAVDRLVETGEAGNLKHAFGIVDQRGLFPGVSDAKSAYYRRKSLR